MRVVAARVPGGPPGRLLYRPQRVRPLHPRVQHRAADDPGFYNQNIQLTRASSPSRPPAPRHPSRGPAIARPLGRRHAGGRDHALQRQGLPEPSRATKRRPLVVPPVPIALKAALYEAFRKAGVSQRRLARALDVAESEVRAC